VCGIMLTIDNLVKKRLISRVFFNKRAAEWNGTFTIFTSMPWEHIYNEGDW
jgi:hypothetical protein